MTGPSWLARLLAALMIVTAAYCFSRLIAAWRRHRRTDYDVDGVHVLMGIAMAGMLVPRINPFWDSGWEVIFAGAVGWFGWQALRGRRSEPAAGQRRVAHHLQHVVTCGAMLYMFLAVAPAKTASTTAMGAGPSTTFPTLALVLTLALVGYVIWNADRFTSLASVAALREMTVPANSVTAPALAASPSGPASAEAEPSATGTLIAGAQAPTGRGCEPSGQAGPPISPRLAAACEIVMGLTMGYMLITML